eukprot:SAG31_NODE_43411_length_267_cov_0.619048_1_plen_50_part_01
MNQVYPEWQLEIEFTILLTFTNVYERLLTCIVMSFIDFSGWYWVDGVKLR